MDYVQLIKDVIDSICFCCAKRLLHMQLFTGSNSSTNYQWIVEYLDEKKKREQVASPDSGTSFGCSACFGLLEKYSQTPYLTQLANAIHDSGIQFADFRISLTAPNNCALRDRFIELTLNSIPTSELSLRLFNPNFLTVKEQWKLLTFHPLEVILGKPYNHTGIFDVKIRFSIEEGLEPDNALLDMVTYPITIDKRISKKARLQKEEQETGFNKSNVDKIIKESTLEDFNKFE